MTPVRALVLDSSPDTLDLLRQYLEFHGLEVETCNLGRLRHEGADIAEAIVRARPHVVIFDIELPYDLNWEFCSTLRRDPRLNIPFVLTTTNRAAVERLTGARDVVEILGKPYDLEQFVQAVCDAASANDGADGDSAGPCSDARRGADRRSDDRRKRERRHFSRSS